MMTTNLLRKPSAANWIPMSGTKAYRKYKQGEDVRRLGYTSEAISIYDEYVAAFVPIDRSEFKQVRPSRQNFELLAALLMSQSAHHSLSAFPCKPRSMAIDFTRPILVSSIINVRCYTSLIKYCVDVFRLRRWRCRSVGSEGYHGKTKERRSKSGEISTGRVRPGLVAGFPNAAGSTWS